MRYGLHYHRIFILFTVLSAIATQAIYAQTGFEGDWLGTLKIQAFELRVVFHLGRSGEGLWKVTMDSPDQGARGIPVDSVLISERDLRLVVLRVRGEYVGTLESGDSTIAGSWQQSGAVLPLSLRRSANPVTVQRPQEPKPPYPYRFEDVSFPNSGAGITLAGTMTKPNGEGPFVAAILISGSGPQDRDETIFGHKPFKVIADYLTRRGIAVLRYDDRGVGGSKGNFASATTPDFASDAQAAVQYLKGRKEIRKDAIGLIGHSEGGIVAPMVASNTPVAFVILLAGPSLRGADIILLQDSLISLANGIARDKIEEGGKLNRTLFSIMETETDSMRMREKMKDALLSSVTDSSVKQDDLEKGVDQSLDRLLSPWFRYFLFYDPVPALKKTRCPVLALNGQKDLQVPSSENLAGIERIIKVSGGQYSVTRELPGLNHLFQHAQSGSPGEYGRIEETFSPDALKIIGDWIDTVIVQ